MATPGRVPLDGTSFFGSRGNVTTGTPRRGAATFGGTPTVPATAQSISPDDILNDAQAHFNPLNPNPESHFNTAAAPTNTPPPTPPPQPGGATPPPASTLPPAHSTNTKAPDGTFRVVNGWDPTKLNDTTHNTAKYEFMRAVQNAGAVGGGLGERGDRASMSADLPRIVQDLQYVGFPSAKLVGDDSIDFGDGNGPIDVLTGNGEWWWSGNQSQPAGPAAGAGGPGAASGAPGGGIPDWIQNLYGGTQGGDASLDGAISGLLGGETPYGHDIGSALSALIKNGGVTPDIKQGLISARENAALAEQGLMADARGRLADSGGLSTPGVEQGATNAAIERTAATVAPTFASAVRDVQNHALDVQNESFMGALQMATGMSRDQATAALGAIGAGTTRQQVLGDLALRQLSLDQDWNKFVAQHGLDVTKLQEDIANGRMDRMIALLHEYILGGTSTAGGYIH